MIVLAIPPLLQMERGNAASQTQNSQITDISENELLKSPQMLSSPAVSFTAGACSPLQGAAPGAPAAEGGLIPTLQIGK